MNWWHRLVAWFRALRVRIAEEKAELRKGNIRVAGVERGRAYMPAELIPKPPSIVATIRKEPTITMKMKVIRADGTEEDEVTFRDEKIKVSRWGLIYLTLTRFWRK